MSVPVLGGAVTTLTTFPSATGSVYCLAVDDSSVYWSGVSGNVYKVAKTGGTPVMILPVADELAIAVDDAGVYLSTISGGALAVGKRTAAPPRVSSRAARSAR